MQLVEVPLDIPALIAYMAIAALLTGIADHPVVIASQQMDVSLFLAPVVVPRVLLHLQPHLQCPRATQLWHPMPFL